MRYLETYLIPPESWDRMVPGFVRIQGIADEGSQPVGYGRHPEKGWFVLGTGQGPFLIYAEWDSPSEKHLDSNTPDTNALQKPLIEVLDRLRKALAENP